MINILILLIHLFFVVYIFYKKFKAENLTTGLLHVGLIGILFAVAWTLSDIISKPINEYGGIYRMVYDSIKENTRLHNYFDASTIPLLFTTIAEFFFYKVYYQEYWGKKEKKKSNYSACS